MQVMIFLFSIFLGYQADAVPRPGLNSQNSAKILNLLARGGVARVFPDHILADVQNLNCHIDRVGVSRGSGSSTTCSGVAAGKTLSLSGERAQELYRLLEIVTVAQSLPAGDSIEVRRMSCRFLPRLGATCAVIR